MEMSKICALHERSPSSDTVVENYDGHLISQSNLRQCLQMLQKWSYQSFCFLIGKPSASHGRPATKQLVLQPIADALTLIVISVSCSPIKKLVVGTFSKTALKQYQEDPINCNVTAERFQYVTALFTIFVLKSFTTALVFIMLQLNWFGSLLT